MSADRMDVDAPNVVVTTPKSKRRKDDEAKKQKRKPDGEGSARKVKKTHSSVS